MKKIIRTSVFENEIEGNKEEFIAEARKRQLLKIISEIPNDQLDVFFDMLTKTGGHECHSTKKERIVIETSINLYAIERNFKF
jgi:hypothetical protein